MPKDREFRARDKTVQKMTRDGLVEQNARTKEETRISDREKDFDLRRSQDLPPKDDRDLSSETRHKRKQQSPVQETASLEQQPEDVSSQEPEKHVQEWKPAKAWTSMVYLALF